MRVDLEIAAVHHSSHRCFNTKAKTLRYGMAHGKEAEGQIAQWQNGIDINRAQLYPVENLAFTQLVLDQSKGKARAIDACSL